MAHNARTADEIQEWICVYIANIMGTSPQSLQVEMEFPNLGVDSSSAAALIGDLEDWLGFELDPTLPYDFPNTIKLSTELARLSAGAAAPTGVPA